MEKIWEHPVCANAVFCTMRHKEREIYDMEILDDLTDRNWWQNVEKKLCQNETILFLSIQVWLLFIS